MSLTLKLILLILTAAGLVFFTAFAYNNYYSRQVIYKEAEASARNLARANAAHIEAYVRAVEKVPSTLAAMLETEAVPEAEQYRLAARVVEDNPEIFGCAIAHEPKGTVFSSPYVCRGKDGGLEKFPLTYNYLLLDWYQIPKELRKGEWTEPYFDEGGGNILMCTYSVPFYGKDGAKGPVKGVVTADVSLRWLDGLIDRIKPFGVGYAFLVSRNGTTISHPDRKLVMRESVFSLAEEHADPQLREVGRDMVRGGEKFVVYKDFMTQKNVLLYYTPLSCNGWSLAVKFDEDALFADARTLSHRILLIGLVGFALLAGAVIFFSHTVTSPLRWLVGTTTEIARGNLDIELPVVNSNDEIGRLTHSFSGMKDALKEYIANLAQTTAAKERIESELKIAHTIQMSFLPKKFPPFPEKRQFEIFASLEPAKEVGGDLYDFFLLGDSHLFLCVGDVAGKGVPAALFMAVTKTLLKGVAEPGMAPAAILTKVNQELCVDNDTMTFTTAFCGILNYHTGELVCSTAGHNPPLLLRADGSNSYLNKMPPGLVLGVNTDAVFSDVTFHLRADDMLVVYSDGVTEAQNGAGELFDEKRLLAVVNTLKNRHPSDAVGQILDAVKTFESGASPADDKTILVVHFKGRA